MTASVSEPGNGMQFEFNSLKLIYKLTTFILHMEVPGMGTGMGHMLLVMPGLPVMLAPARSRYDFALSWLWSWSGLGGVVGVAASPWHSHLSQPYGDTSDMAALIFPSLPCTYLHACWCSGVAGSAEYATKRYFTRECEYSKVRIDIE